MVKPKGKLAALPDLLSLELSLVVILGFLSGLILTSGISLLKDFGAVFAPRLCLLSFLSALTRSMPCLICTLTL